MNGQKMTLLGSSDHMFQMIRRLMRQPVVSMPNATKIEAFGRGHLADDVAYATPWCFFNYWHRRLHFDRDVCADATNAKCRKYWTRQTNALNQMWDISAGPTFFMNAPYGRPKGVAAWGKSGLWPWVKKARTSSLENGVTVGALLPCWTGDLWFHQFCRHAEINFIRRRITFISAKRDGEDNQAGFESMFVVFRPDDLEKGLRVRVRFTDCPVKD